MNQAYHFGRTRLAPTPSGYLHLGNLFSFSLTAALAAKSGAKILLRIDDLDQDRVRPEYVEDIFETLSFMNIAWHEGPDSYESYLNNYSQLGRQQLYNKALNYLKENNMVYACSCSRNQVHQNGFQGSYPGTCRLKGISLDEKDVCWRLITDGQVDLKIKDLKEGGVTTKLPATMFDFIVKKKDSCAAYQLSSLIDDWHFGVDFIVRGEDLWPSTLAQTYLAGVLNQTSFLNTVFYHHPLVKNAEGVKLSKSAGDTSVKALRAQFKNPIDIYRLIGRAARLPFELTSWQDLIPLVE